MITSIYKGYKRTRKTRKTLSKPLLGLPMYLWLLVLLYGLYKTYKSSIEDWFDTTFGTTKAENNLPTYSSNISATEAQNRAENIYNSWGLNDNENQIYNQLKDVNLHGYNRIFNYYGKRKHFAGLGELHFTDLTQTLVDRLDQDEIKALINLNPALSFLS